ncbi:MAG: cyclic pyranopterin monophosphate synthase MoaC [Candidatus Lindowbacteria bacterium]|nr:cyclic pyranopterin monophosphate synthase MoaC [Candidatus Lindowbacteria bacterium]
MVSVSEKDITTRTATAQAIVKMSKETAAKVRNNELKKGEVVSVVRIAGIQAAKKTSDLIPLCHPLGLDSVQVECDVQEDSAVITATATTDAKTGVEMEAMTAVTIAAVTFYDMVKSIERGVTIENIRVLHKDGGRSGIYTASE